MSLAEVIPDFEHFPISLLDLLRASSRSKSVFVVDAVAAKRLDHEVRWKPFVGEVKNIDFEEHLGGEQVFEELLEDYLAQTPAAESYITFNRTEVTTSPFTPRSYNFDSHLRNDVVTPVLFREQDAIHDEAQKTSPRNMFSFGSEDDLTAPKEEIFSDPVVYIGSDTSPFANTVSQEPITDPTTKPLSGLDIDHNLISKFVEAENHSDSDRSAIPLSKADTPIFVDHVHRLSADATALDTGRACVPISPTHDDPLSSLLKRKRALLCEAGVSLVPAPKNMKTNLEDFMRLRGVEPSKEPEVTLISPLPNITAEVNEEPIMSNNVPVERSIIAPSECTIAEQQSINGEIQYEYSWIVATSLLQQTKLLRRIRELNRHVHFLERDLDVMSEADLISSYGSGLILFRVDHIEVAANAAEHSLCQLRLLNVLKRYQDLHILVCCTGSYSLKEASMVAKLSGWSSRYATEGQRIKFIVVGQLEEQAQWVTSIAREMTDSYDRKMILLDQESFVTVPLVLPSLTTISTRGFWGR